MQSPNHPVILFQLKAKPWLGLHGYLVRRDFAFVSLLASGFCGREGRWFTGFGWSLLPVTLTLAPAAGSRWSQCKCWQTQPRRGARQTWAMQQRATNLCAHPKLSNEMALMEGKVTVPRHAIRQPMILKWDISQVCIMSASHSHLPPTTVRTNLTFLNKIISSFCVALTPRYFDMLSIFFLLTPNQFRAKNPSYSFPVGRKS